MPLAEFTQYAMQGIERGDFIIVVPATKPAWDSIEKQRVEMCMQMQP